MLEKVENLLAIRCSRHSLTRALHHLCTGNRLRRVVLSAGLFSKAIHSDCHVATEGCRLENTAKKSPSQDEIHIRDDDAFY